MPLDIHSIVLYYNKDLLKKAGLLGDDGLPKGLDGIDELRRGAEEADRRGTAPIRPVIRAAADNDGSTDLAHLLHAAEPEGGKFLKDGKVLPGDNLAKAEKATQTHRRLGGARAGRRS